MGSAINRKWEDPVTDLSAKSATATGTWLPTKGADVVRILVTSTGTTSGATVLLEGNTKADGTGDTFTANTITANADSTFRDETIVDADNGFAAYRTRISSYTDGTHTSSVQFHR